MIDEQTKRAIETMAQCGCDLESLCSMFPQASKDDIVSIWNYIVDSKKNMDDYTQENKISCNCS